MDAWNNAGSCHVEHAPIGKTEMVGQLEQRQWLQEGSHALDIGQTEPIVEAITAERGLPVTIT